MERQCLFKCIICERQCDTGISILGMHICSRCEAALVASKAEGPGYDMYVKSLGVIWRRVLSLEPDRLADNFSSQFLEATTCSDPATG